ncbi:MAG: signal peptidase II [Clostridiales Family XIII bacterium]|nr:signal peptidase II [Clostridiales Family XIII bacterium]
MKIKVAKLILLGLVSIFLDRLTKFFVEVNLQVGEKVEIIPDFIYIKFIKNDGTAFSFFSGQKLVLIFIPIILILLILFFIIKYSKKLDSVFFIFFGSIIGGGLSNLYDRIFSGEVVDFIAVANFPVFNFADISITIGGFLFVIFYIIKEYGRHKNSENS